MAKNEPLGALLGTFRVLLLLATYIGIELAGGALFYTYLYLYLYLLIRTLFVASENLTTAMRLGGI